MSATQNVSFYWWWWIHNGRSCCLFLFRPSCNLPFDGFLLSPFKNHLWGFIMALAFSPRGSSLFKPTTKKHCVLQHSSVFKSVWKYFFYSLLLEIFSIMFKHYIFIVRICNCSIHSKSFELLPILWFVTICFSSRTQSIIFKQPSETVKCHKFHINKTHTFLFLSLLPLNVREVEKCHLMFSKLDSKLIRLGSSSLAVNLNYCCLFALFRFYIIIFLCNVDAFDSGANVNYGVKKWSIWYSSSFIRPGCK